MFDGKYEKIAKKYLYFSIILFLIMILISLIFKDSSSNYFETLYFISGILLPLITLISITLIIGTFKLQQYQIQLNLEDMKESQLTNSIQNRTAQLQRFENSYYLLLERFHLLQENFINKKPNHYRNMRKKLDYKLRINSNLLRYNVQQKIEKLQTVENKAYVDDEIQQIAWKSNEMSYKSIYDTILTMNSKNLNFDIQNILNHFIHILRFIDFNKTYLTVEEMKSYFDYFLLDLDNDLKYLLFYLLIYNDESEILLFLNEIDRADAFDNIVGPYNFTKDRSMWNYIYSNAGNLDPYPLSSIYSEIAEVAKPEIDFSSNEYLYGRH